MRAKRDACWSPLLGHDAHSQVYVDLFTPICTSVLQSKKKIELSLGDSLTGMNVINERRQIGKGLATVLPLTRN